MSSVLKQIFSSTQLVFRNYNYGSPICQLATKCPLSHLYLYLLMTFDFLLLFSFFILEGLHSLLMHKVPVSVAGEFTHVSSMEMKCL